MQSPARHLSAGEFLFRDGFGERLLVRNAHDEPAHEALVVRSALSGLPSFQFALHQRAAQLTDFRHEAFARIVGVSRTCGTVPRLSVLADHRPGVRLSEVLAALERANGQRHLGAWLFIVREILRAVAALHQLGTDISHGTLAAERIVIANGTLCICDYVMGPAIEQLQFSPERYWKELRVAVPVSAGVSRMDRRVDVAQIGMIALALCAGRELRDDEHMGNLGGALASVSVPDAIRQWLWRALHLDPRRTYVSAVEGLQSFDEAVGRARLQLIALDSTPVAISRRTLRAVPPTRSVAPAASTPPRTVLPVVPPLAAPSGFGARLHAISAVIGMLGIAVAGTFTSK